MIARVTRAATEAVDSTGAGDAFAAGFLAGLRAGLTAEEALERGCETGATAVAQVGSRPNFKNFTL
jgi:sugar/nucleoside kinase (ribokinase family)